ncbi:hypothetical protein IH785_17835 [candidate division KSB1 bacterium]|nr:hypothetical protein [candidate division KSB1 bacterium]
MRIILIAFEDKNAPTSGFSQSLMEKILAMEKKYDEKFKLVFKAIYQLMEEEEKPKHQIGFTTKDDK